MLERAHYDPLTALPGPARFRYALQRALDLAERKNGQLAILSVGIDWSGSARVKLQHGTRERLLVEVARRLREVTRRSDTVARLGDAAFGVLLQGAPGESARAVADKVVAVLSRPVADGDCLFMVHAVVGLAHFPEDGRAADELLQHANEALARKREADDERHPERHAHSRPQLPPSRRLQLGTRLRASLASGTGLELDWLPIVRLADGAVIGAEAQPRWEDEGHGAVAGARLIQLAGQNGLLGELDRWVLEVAARTAAPWLQAGPAQERAIVVNVSANYLRRLHATEEIMAILAGHGVRPEQVQLDLSEHTLADLGATAWQVFHALRSEGIGLSVDDFGASQSNLASLARLAPDRLKLGAAFVRNVGTSDVDRAVVGALAFLGRSLGMKVVADAVEGAPQLELLHDLGCEEAQGPLFGPPTGLAALPGNWPSHGAAHGPDRDGG